MLKSLVKSRGVSLAVLSAAAITASVCSTSNAAVLYTANLSTGALLGQDGWAATGSPPSTVNPIQATSPNVINLQNTGADANTPLSSPVTSGDVYLAAKLNITATQATGDYFLHFANSPTDSSLFTGRIFAKSTTGGYLLGVQVGSSGVVYGTNVLALSTDVSIILDYDIISGATNDVMTLYVNPTDPVQGNNTPYVSLTDVSVSEPTQSFGTVNVRQGSATAAATLTVTGLTVATSFSDVGPAGSVPEPMSLSMLGLGGVALMVRRRKA